jgi:hypothetical protein
MNKNNHESNTGTRREFLVSAGAATAGATALAGVTAPAEAQEEKKAAAPAQPQSQPIRFRASAPHAVAASRLGPLADLPGTWMGKGFNLISLPDFHDGKPFRLQLNTTVETLQFTPVGGKVPNRGSAQDDILLFGVTYLQRVSDGITNSALHIEPGLWLHVPATTTPNAPESIVRQGTIPHGDSLLATGPVIDPIAGGPSISPVDSTPSLNPPGAPLGADYLAPFANPPLPDGFKLPYVKNINLALQDAISGQNIVRTVVLLASTSNGGGILNIPFVTSNANATKLDTIFWIETVQQSDGSQFLQLQYTQTVILNFLGIDWPHISVATLVKQ